MSPWRNCDFKTGWTHSHLWSDPNQCEKDSMRRDFFELIVNLRCLGEWRVSLKRNTDGSREDTSDSTDATLVG